MRGQPLLAWQWSLYPDGHRNRGNLVLHAATVPLFMSGCLAILLSPVTSVWFAVAGGAAMASALVAQGRGHRQETTAPVPFDGPFDFVRRFLAEQWVTFPRFVVSGGFARAWRGGDSRERRDPR